MTTEVKELLAHPKKIEEDAAIAKNVNVKLVERVVSAECRCCEDAEYLRRNTLEVVGIPTSVMDNVFEQKVCWIHTEMANTFGDKIGYITRYVAVFSM